MPFQRNSLVLFIFCFGSFFDERLIYMLVFITRYLVQKVVERQL